MHSFFNLLVSLLLVSLLLASSLSTASYFDAEQHRKTCEIKSGGTNATDDAPAIIEAFEECGRGGVVRFLPNTTYYVNSIMNISWLDDVDIDVQGTLLWSTDIQYWLNNSMDVGYQNQSTALILGGNNVRLQGHGQGTLNGNGDYWYQFIRAQPNTSNYPGRPHAITFNGLNNSAVSGLNFLRSQMWTMSIIYSHNVTFDSIFVNNTGNVVSSSNTDGADTILSSHIAFNNWTVYNGDDSISLKANSTDISISNSHFYNGLGIALGSIGQYKGQYEVIEGLTVENITYTKTLHAVYFKTWTGDQVNYPPNGGGGGLGVVSNMTITNLTATALRGAAFTISQCTSFSGGGTPSNCSNSEMEIRDITVDGLSGTTASTSVASLQCSAVKPCTNIGLFDIDLTLTSNGTGAAAYLCSEVVDNVGFTCTGPACVGSSDTGGC